MKQMSQPPIAKVHATLGIFLMAVLSFSLHISTVRFVYAQQQSQQQIPSATDELVTYEKHSGFIKEFPVPLEERGLRGITTDSGGDAWFLHSTNKSSTILKLEPNSGKLLNIQ